MMYIDPVSQVNNIVNFWIDLQVHIFLEVYYLPFRFLGSQPC